MLNTREERLKQLLEQARALREQRVPAAEADINAKLISDLGYNFAKVGQAFTKQTPERSDFAFTPTAAPRLAAQEKQIGEDIQNLSNESLYDPYSPLSKAAQALYQKTAGPEAPSLEGLSASELKNLPTPVLQPKVTPEAKAETELELYRKKSDINKKVEKELADYRNSLKGGKADAGNVDIKQVPAEEKEAILSLGRQNAAKVSIGNQILATIKILDDPNVPRDQKITQGRQMLKVLNSTQGQDAVGAEEAKRLGSFLETSLGVNWNSPRAFGDFGINLEGFRNQAFLTQKAIFDSVKANEDDIARRYAKYGVSREPSAAIEPAATKPQPKAAPQKITKEAITAGKLLAKKLQASKDPAERAKGVELAAEILEDEKLLKKGGK